MSMPITTRRTSGKKTPRRYAESRSFPEPTKPAGFVKGGDLAWRRKNHRLRTQLPIGFMTAVNDAFTRRGRICDRVRRLLEVLDEFEKPPSALPTKVRHFLDRFDASQEVGR